jgi:hypothetical protein
MTQERSMESILQTIREFYAREAEIDIVSIDGATRATTVYFVCSKCALPYRATQVRRSKAVAGKMDCLDCRGLVHRWSGLYDFIDWQPRKT